MVRQEKNKCQIKNWPEYEVRIQGLRGLRSNKIWWSLFCAKVWVSAVCMKQREWLVNRWSCWQDAGFIGQLCVQLAGGHQRALPCLSVPLYHTRTLAVKTCLSQLHAAVKKKQTSQQCDLCTEVCTIWQGKRSCSVLLLQTGNFFSWALILF